MYLQAERKTVWILIRWLRQKPADLIYSVFFLKKKTNPGSAGQGLNYSIFAAIQRNVNSNCVIISVFNLLCSWYLKQSEKFSNTLINYWTRKKFSSCMREKNVILQLIYKSLAFWKWKAIGKKYLFQMKSQMAKSLFYMKNNNVSKTKKIDNTYSLCNSHLQPRDRGATGSSLTGVPWARHIDPSLVLVQPRKTRPYIDGT